MKIKLWLRRQSISAPRMKVTTAGAWPARIVFSLAALFLGILIGVWVPEPIKGWRGTSTATVNPEMENAVRELSDLRLDRDRLATSANAAESQLNMERAAQKELTTQLKLLEGENTRLKEDLAFFESLLPVDPRASGVSIRGISAEMTSSSQLQYRLLVMKGGKRATNFEGTLRLSIGVIQNGRPVTLNFPDGKSGESNSFKLGFRHYQRLEGILTLPPDVSPRSLQVTVLEGGQVRAQQTLNL